MGTAKIYYQCDECGKLGLAKWGGMGRGDTLYLPEGFNYKNSDGRILEMYRGIICDECNLIKNKKIYVASSWRNEYHENVVFILKCKGHEVYDFKNPEPENNGFSWSEIDKNWKEWSPIQFKKALENPLAEKGFILDLNAMKWANICILVLPCGRSAHTEAGWMKGQGKKVFVYSPEKQEPELMYKIYDNIYTNINDLLSELEK